MILKSQSFQSLLCHLRHHFQMQHVQSCRNFVFSLNLIEHDKLQKLTTFYQTPRENKITIISDTLHLKMVEEVEEVVLETLTFLVLFQISSKIFLVKVLVVEGEDQEGLTIVALI